MFKLGRFRTLPALMLLSATLAAQNSTIVGAGYGSPVPLYAAPGQVLTLFVQGLGQHLPHQATDTSWPTSLDGISVALIQDTRIPVPILEVWPISTCVPPFALQIPCGTTTAITVQIPYELIPLCPLCLRPFGPSPTLVVSENGQDGFTTAITPLADQVHILTSCDFLLQPFVLENPVNYSGLPCPPMVIHGDGQLVSAANTAKQGEELAAYAVGIGATNPAARTGQPASAPLRAVQSMRLDYNFRPNALPTKPADGSPVALFTGLTPQYPGLYQINFVVPAVPKGTQPCAASSAPGANVIQSNLTVSFGGAFSFDGAGICVAPNP